MRDAIHIIHMHSMEIMGSMDAAGIFKDIYSRCYNI